MSARYRVHLTTAVRDDLKAIFEYLSRRSPNAAMQLLKKLRLRARSLRSVPLRGRAVPELAELGMTNFRELIEAPYRILYRIAENDVFVLAVLDGRRDLEDVLLERLTRIP